MRQAVVERLVALNRAFYRSQADAFARTRRRPQPGYRRLIAWLPAGCRHLLDVGCGEGRLGRALLAWGAIAAYTGLDFSPELLALAQGSTAGTFLQRDLSQPGCLAGLGPFPAIACLSTWQHLPGRANRLRLLREMAGKLEPGGCLILANWQFRTSRRQRAKIVPWQSVGLEEGMVERNDFLLTWGGDPGLLRYVAYLDEAEVAALARDAGMAVADHFYSDGREGNLNLYSLLHGLHG